MTIRVDASKFDLPNLVDYQPFQLRGESADSEVIALASIPADEVRAIRPPVPLALFPPDGIAHPIPWRIEDAVGAVPTDRSWASDGSRGTPRLRPKTSEAEMNGSIRNSMGVSSQPYG